VKVAVIGTGVAGLVAAHRLHAEHELTVYEAGPWIGGHVNTVDVPDPSAPGGSLAVDTGFIVFNERSYPGFCALLRELGVAWQPSDMSFSVRCERTGLEYNGTSLNGLLAQRRNALRPAFWRMVRDILRFYREAPGALADTSDGPDGPLLGAWLARNGYSRAFVEQHLVPMGAAIWSARPEAMLAFPLRFLVRFFQNHGFLQVDGRPQWLVVRGGSREYVRALTRPFRERIRLSTPVSTVERTPRGVRVRDARGEEAFYDRVVLATHADTSLALLADPSQAEREVLGAFGWQRNQAVLHRDATLMPRARRAWASWNYHVGPEPAGLPMVTYWMNNLQRLETREGTFVTLNRADAIDPACVLARFTYHHPIYSAEAVRAQARRAEIDGVRDVHFCGAYWGYGFHEDGVESALQVLRDLAGELVA
jgi:predicted NAD/FAD-binding protein